MICFICCAKMRDIDTYNEELRNEKIINYCRGFCPKCKKFYHWEEVYTFMGIENFKEGK